MYNIAAGIKDRTKGGRQYLAYYYSEVNAPEGGTSVLILCLYCSPCPK